MILRKPETIRQIQTGKISGKQKEKENTIEEIKLNMRRKIKIQ